ncbi:MAG: hypothetical protein WCF65_07015 [Parachlamydiaceae bacterium]
MSAASNTLKTDWMHRLEQWKLSGLSSVKWCQEQGLAIHTFYYWRTKLTPSLKTIIASPDKFVELVDNSPSVSGISIEYRGVSVHLSKGFHPESLMSCLKTLQKI